MAAREALAEYKGQDVALLTNRGLFLAELGRLEEALAAYERAIRLNPNDADAYYNQGNVHQELERLEEAKQAFRKARALRSQS